MRWVDLTRPIRSGQPVYPGDPAVRFVAHGTIAADGFAVTRLELGSHSGTHLDAPAHVDQCGRGVDGTPLEALIGPARVLDVSHRGAGEEISKADLSVSPLPERLLLRSDWDSRYGLEGYFDEFPGLSLTAVDHIVNGGVRLLGLETPSVHPAHELEAHRSLLESDIIIVEGLTGLRLLPSDVWLVVLPLPLDGLDGSPCRAVAFPGAIAWCNALGASSG